MKKLLVVLLVVLSLLLVGCDTNEEYLNTRVAVGSNSRDYDHIYLEFDLDEISEFTIIMDSSNNIEDIDFSPEKYELPLDIISSIRLYENGYLRIVYKDNDEIWIRPDIFAFE